MGIKGLAKLLSDEAPDSIREIELKSLHGRKIAIDASMSIYQFLIAVRSAANSGASLQLTNDAGEVTSHIQGLWSRTIRMMELGIKPVYIFDGKPPNLKSHELTKRREKRAKAEEALKQAKEDQNVEEVDKQSKRLVRAGPKENADCQKLLNLMGVPILVAPCEAEAQASALAKDGKVYATATEDMDALTFQTPILLRKLTFAGNKANLQSINYEKALEGLDLNHDQFVDLCILLGCDYCDTIRGVGPKTALKLIKTHKNIEEIIKNLDRKKFKLPEGWERPEKSDSDNEDDQDDDTEFMPAYQRARQLFLEHKVQTEPPAFKWKPCDEDGLRKFLVDDMGFQAERVQSSIDKLKKAHKANQKPQSRMDSFFKKKPGVAKRKVTPVASKAAKKKSKK